MTNSSFGAGHEGSGFTNEHLGNSRPGGELAVVSDRGLQAQLSCYARDLRRSYCQELRLAAELQASRDATVEALVVAVAAKDDITGSHVRRVSQLGQLLAQAHLGAAGDDPQLGYGFLLHDIGKLAVPDSVLNKPGKLSAEEAALIRLHPETGAQILQRVPFLDGALEIVRHHHERWDGGGYPSGQRGQEIPIGARLFSIVDTVDAMTSNRPYRAAMGLKEATAEVVRQAGAQFDPACVKTFVAVAPTLIQRLLEPQERLAA
jgi:HD-GYP domain-containing protein (c-di-GMP phosphodiesterase class II)